MLSSLFQLCKRRQQHKEIRRKESNLTLFRQMEDVVKNKTSESERRSKKFKRREQKLMRMPKEKRVKEISAQHLKLAFELGIVVGKAFADKKTKRLAMSLEEMFRKKLRPGLTNALIRRGVLPSR